MIRTLVMVVALSVGLTVFARGAIAQESLSISGTVWEDLNANGIRDPEDPPIQTFVHLRTADAGQRSMRRTDANGHYEFTDVQPGRHVVALGSSQLLYWTFPARHGSGDYTIAVNVTSTPVSGVDFGVHQPREHMSILARTWLHGSPDAGTKVRAFIGAADCTGPTSALLPPGGSRTFYFSVISSDLDPACGDPGDIIRFEVNGLPANETAVWEDRLWPAQPAAPPPLANPVRITLTVGPPFGYLTLESTSPAGGEQFPMDRTVFGYVDGKLCASNEGTGFTSYLVIRSTEYPGGCGYAGATVDVVIEGAVVKQVAWSAGFMGAIQVPWRPWRDDEAGEISPPSVGDAGLR